MFQLLSEFRVTPGFGLHTSMGALLALGWCCLQAAQGNAAELVRITAENYSSVVPSGKEVDAILGDWVLRNERITAVIAQPVVGRKANMTVRGVSGMLIDLTRRHFESDQLSCFYPAAGRYLFEDPAALTCQVDGLPRELTEVASLQGKLIEIIIQGAPLSADGTRATVRYTLRDNQDWLEYSVSLINESDKPLDLSVEDSLRCDGNLFTTGNDASTRLYYVADQYFGQAYGWVADQGMLVANGRSLKPSESSPQTVAPGGSLDWGGKISCSQGLPGLRCWALGLGSDARRQPVQLNLRSPQGRVAHAEVEFFREGQSLGALNSDEQGMLRAELLAGEYRLQIASLGREDRDHSFVVKDSAVSETLSLPPASRVSGSIVDDNQRPIAAKIQFQGLDGTADPNFGPDSAAYAVKNLVYCANGRFEQPVAPGKYRLLISHGPEYDAQTVEFELAAGSLHSLKAELRRSVDTRGWVSADFHSHSSPSGDNVSQQLGRVLNLLAEHIEFAPCTEHNRIDTYEDDLLLLGATAAMATCTGMELTGSPLPINHQNAFPLKRHVHQQDGGGPQVDTDPVAQIERLALWDDTASKVVQTNHPNIPQILGDRDMDGKPDDGFRGMLGWMDVIEVHPPQGIFATPASDISPKDKYENPIFFWMQLLNLGYRIPGVVNTDAHYNFHGSGWLRNYLASSSDDPARISIDEMIHAAEHGHMIMTSGPFLQAEVQVDGKNYIAGDNVSMQGKSGNLKIRVQCPNWMDINRVQVFANGRPVESLNFTRKTHPQLFHDDTLRFELQMKLPSFDSDVHLIVATIGEGLKLGPIMGPQNGEAPPVAVCNPIFVDYDGQGFQANGDDLGVPFMLPKLQP